MTVTKQEGKAAGGVTRLQLARPVATDLQQKDADAETYFPNYGSYMVFGVQKTLEALLLSYKKQLSAYNARLTALKIPLRVRAHHSVEVRGKKYVYAGRYLFRKDRVKAGGKLVTREVYLGKMDNALLRNEMKDRWVEAGPPPDSPLEGLHYTVVTAGSAGTGAVIIRGGDYINPGLRHLFAGKTAYRLA